MKYPQGHWDLQTQVRASDGARIHGWLVSQKDARLATLFLHGNAGNLTHRVNHIQQITAAGSSILVIDYRGYGKSAGQPSEPGLYRDAETGYQYLVDAGPRPDRRSSSSTERATR
jgi:pimeloyl-ACP methyl ester carboxylesterase